MCFFEAHVIAILNGETVKPVLTDKNTNKRVIRSNINQNTVNIKFKEILDIPYNEKSMNCKHKSELFAEYLSEIGGEGVYLVIIQHDSGKYSHEFVEWGGRYYDSCNTNELSYLISKEEYLNKLHKIGFNGIVIQSPYIKS